MADARCRLCRSAEIVAGAEIAIAAIVRYWKGFGCDLAGEFPDLPQTLAARRCAACGLGWYEPDLIGGPSLYAALEQWPPYYRADAWEWPIAIEILKAAGVRHLVEIGAGTGEFLARARPHFTRVLGLEVNEAAVRKAQERGLPVVNQRIDELAEPADAIVVFQVLEHLADPAGFITACRAKLPRDGLLAVAVPNDDGAIGVIDGDFLNLPPHHATRWRRATLEATARLFGFALVDYRIEPLSRALHRHFRLRHLRPGQSVSAKLANRLKRYALAATASFTFSRDRARIGGENHLAIFRKLP